jgi:hypothetical protein
MIIYFIFILSAFRNVKKWLNCCHPIFRNHWIRFIYTIVYILLALSPAAILLPPISIKASLVRLGFFCYILIGVLIAGIAGRILRIRRKMPHIWTDKYKKICKVSGTVITLAAVCICTCGTIHANHIKEKDYQVKIDKKAENLTGLRIGLVSDLHLGYHAGTRELKQMVTKLNHADLDLVCLTGDFYSNDFDAVSNPKELSRILSKIKATYGTYACYGNHDVSQKVLAGFPISNQKRALLDPRLDQMLKDGNVKVLQDESVYIDHAFYLIGRLDASETGVPDLRPNTISEISKTIDLEKPIIVMEHQPKDLHEQARAGMDLSLAGHTHKGQFFPGNLFIKLFWKNSYGKYQENNFTSIVTSGMGTWGPDMRIGTNSEIAIIDVSFAK